MSLTRVVLVVAVLEGGADTLAVGLDLVLDGLLVLVDRGRVGAGLELTGLLLSAPGVTQVIAPTRRTLPNKDARLQNVLIDFDRLDEYPELFDVDVILCCLGTTMKQAGSRENFRKVDYQYSKK